MQRISFKLYFITLIFTLTLASFAFAGDAQCPLAPTPTPANGNRTTAAVIINTNPTVDSTYQFLKGFWESFTQTADLF
jgi:hypothetical protein